MKQRTIVSLITTILISLSLAPVHAGGAPFTTLTFPDATISTCGSWLASGGGGLATDQYPFVYVVTDGAGTVVSSGQFVGSLDAGISRPFTVQPARNPLHFVATSTYLTDSYTVGDLYANDPCLPNAAQLQVQSTCPGDLPSQLNITEQGFVQPGLPNALRDKPGLTRDGSTVIGWLPESTEFTVLAGPICVSGYAWWYITYDNHFGWTPESTATEYWLGPVIRLSPMG